MLSDRCIIHLVGHRRRPVGIYVKFRLYSSVPMGKSIANIYRYAEKVKAYMEENNILVRLFTDRDVLHLRITIAPKDIMKRVLFHLKHAIADSRGGKER